MFILININFFKHFFTQDESKRCKKIYESWSILNTFLRVLMFKLIILLLLKIAPMNQAIDNSSSEFKRVNKGNKGRFFQKDNLSQFFIFTYASQKKDIQSKNLLQFI